MALQLLASHAAETASKGISSSPTIVISAGNVKEGTSMSKSVSDYRNTNAIKDNICGMYAVAGTTAPAACNSGTTLSSNNASASGSCG
jgi:hypothetical protein